MRRHGWQLPYHPLQVVAIAVFLALGFAFYVFFLPFVGKKRFEYVVFGIYTPLVTSVFCLYVWCAAADPADPGLFKSKKYLYIADNGKPTDSTNFMESRDFKQEGESTSSMNEEHAVRFGDKQPDKAVGQKSSNELEKKNISCCNPFCQVLFGWCSLLSVCNWPHSHEQSSEQQMSEDGMFYCSLCEVEVYKYSKHCRVCDKCVDGFDHHCRWLNNCIGRKNYRWFFVLMMSALLLLIIQWSIGVLVLIRCFLERKRFSIQITTKLGSSFFLMPFVTVVASCTFLAMLATLPLAQLFFFHVLLIKKGISTYDYIIALREEQQDVGGQQSPQMSSLSSLTGMSSASSFSTFHRGAWCTPPRLFVDDQFDVVPPDTGTSAGKKVLGDEPRKRTSGTVKISPWTLARLNAEEVSKAAAQARKNSRVLQTVVRREMPRGQETNPSFGTGSSQLIPRIDNRRRMNKRGRFLTNLPLEPLAKISASATDSNGSDLAPETSTSLAPLQLEARGAFRTSQVMSSAGIVAPSPDSSLDSPDLHSFRRSSSGAEEAQGFMGYPSAGADIQKGIQLSRSTSDGYEASGGEDSDRVPSRIVHRSSNWSNLLLIAGHGANADESTPSSSSVWHANAKPL